MRVTDRLVFDNASRDTARARTAATEASSVASTGTRIHHPSDDPAAAGMIPAFQMSGARFASIGQAAGLASDELEATDGALDAMATAISRARELAMQFSNPYSAAQRAGGALEVGQLIDHVRSMLNTQFGNRYVFGGTVDDKKPFDPTGKYATNDQAGVSATLGGLVAGTDTIANARAEVGASMHAFDTAVTASKVAADSQQSEASKLGEVDLVEASIQLQATQTALQASLAAAAQSFRLTLLDYLK